ncbi:putative diphthamide synthesis protein-domain-containing protein [Rhizoctonia solani]|nr:putative diphthamide synthesis protein-domain-containing protein [Rhizoctonia solani]
MSITQPPPSGAFSTAGEEAINRSVEIRSNELTASDVRDENIDELFEIQDTAQCIIDNDYKQIALQFPDELLGVSVPIYNRLKQLLGDGRSAYVLADTTYGSCCVDEVASAHIDADVVVHYGHTCLSPTSRLPVIYVFGKRPIDIPDCFNQLGLVIRNQLADTGLTKSLILKSDVSYAYSTGEIQELLKKEFPDTEVVAPDIPTRYVPPPSASAAAPYAPADPDQPSEPIAPLPSTSPVGKDAGFVTVREGIPTENSLILYIGGESLALTNFLLTHSSSEVVSYDPQTRSTRRETGGVNKLLMRRYAIIQKARDADVIGILVGTLGVASYLPLMAHLRQLLSKAQKKCYTISVGKLNPAKLANFMEIECFVLVACPENSVIDSKEFYRPIVTPFELEIALGADRSWTGEYVLNFDQLLFRQKSEGDISNDQDSDEDPDRPSFSLVTGTYRHAKRYVDPRDIDNERVDSGSYAVALRNNEGALSQAVTTAGSEFLHSRSFQGLEQRLGQDEPAILEQGRSGIAKGYHDVDHAPTS